MVGDMAVKNPLWRQDSPADQLTVLRMALEGHMVNAMDGIVPSHSFARMGQLFGQLQELEVFLRLNPNQWVEE